MKESREGQEVTRSINAKYPGARSHSYESFEIAHERHAYPTTVRLAFTLVSNDMDRFRPSYLGAMRCQVFAQGVRTAD